MKSPTGMNSVSVLVADDHSVVRAGVRHVLEATPNVTIVAEASDAAAALQLARTHTPDIVVLDVSMPGGSGLSVLPALRRDVPNARIIVLSVHDDPEYIDESMRAGAHGYLLKETAANDLRPAVTAVLAGRHYFSSALTDRVARKPADASGTRITARERQVLVRVARGETSKQIAGELGISPRTVETHRESIARKLGVSSVAALTRYAIENGLSDD